jgi:two-component system CheB/CheR fusion protein
MEHQMEMQDLYLEQAQQSDRTILIVEDDQEVGHFLLVTIHVETPYFPFLVPDSHQALKILQKIKPVLLILDYQLPGKMNGIQLYDHLQSLEGATEVPAILLTGSSKRFHTEVRGRKLLIVRKPLEVDDFLETIQKLLG